MKARLIQFIDGKWLTAEFEASQARAEIERRGFTFTGLNTNPRQRVELQGQPKFKGLLGPMWDGDAVRYEDQGAYDALSV